MLLLWCFGIIILAEHPHQVGLASAPLSSFDPKRPEPVCERQWKTASGRKLFGSSRGLHKTINLTYLSVIWACKGGVGVSDVEAIEGIRIAVRTMQVVNEGVRQAWPSSGQLALDIAPKLPSKILRQGINSTVQLEVRNMRQEHGKMC